MKLILIAALMLIPEVLYAVSLELSEPSYYTDGTVSTDVVLINENRLPVNALEGSALVFGLEGAYQVSTESSIVPIWLERPEVEGANVQFSGIIPGGLSSGGPLFTLSWEAVEEEARFETRDVSVFLNDGSGTEVALENDIFFLETSSDKPREMLREKEPDREAPVFSAAEISRDASLYENKFFAVFLAQDKGSGVDYYEIQERYFGSPDNNGWKRAMSPYVLDDQWLFSSVYIKAVDAEGNVMTTNIPAERSPLLAIGVLLVGVVFLVIIGMYVRRR